MTQLERINECIRLGYGYNPQTGIILNPNGRVVSSKHNGYIRISFYFQKKRYRIFGHKLAYYLIHKETAKIIDHINGIRDDNRIINLRSATIQENQHNHTKAKGYSWHKASQKWRATITINGKSKHLGLFDSKEEASECYKSKKHFYHK